ncbi:MAG: hypothetical protein A2W91_09870 [Bacteroidetes bacterium GWF2_38_335]|nr:MAG: hypothetical protein A2W91_09870 [Bacteroidetes bacterium GWF2_38_335]
MPIVIAKIIPVKGSRKNKKEKKNMTDLTNKGAFFTLSTSTFEFNSYCLFIMVELRVIDWLHLLILFSFFVIIF